jgi:hypothetical protein
MRYLLVAFFSLMMVLEAILAQHHLPQHQYGQYDRSRGQCAPPIGSDMLTLSSLQQYLDASNDKQLVQVAIS